MTTQDQSQEPADLQALLDAYGVTLEEYQSFLKAKAEVDAGGQGWHPQWALMMELHEDIEGEPTVKAEAEITVEDAERTTDDIIAEMQEAAPGTQQFMELEQEARQSVAGDPQGQATLDVMLARLQNQDPRVQGMFNAAGWDYDIQGQGTEGLFYDMWQYAAEHWGTDLPESLQLNPADTPDGFSYEEWVASRMQSWLANNQEGALQHELLTLYGEDEGMKAQAATLGEAGTPTDQVAYYAQLLGVSTRKAAKIIDMGARRDLNAEQSATLWKFAEANDLLAMGDYSGDSIVRRVQGGSTDPNTFWGNIFGTAIDIGVQMVGGEERARELAEPYLDDIRDEGKPDWLRDYEDLGADPIHRATVSSNQLFGMYQTAIENYGTDIPALVSLTSKDLADRLVSDPYGLSTAERRGIWNMISKDENLKNMMQNSFMGGAQLSWLQGMAGGGESLVKVDKESVRDATRTLLSAWNLPGMSDRFVDSVANSFAAGQKVAAQNAIGNPFDPEWQGPYGPSQRVVDNPIDKMAHAKKAIRGTKEYQKWFANKGDLTEEEYVGRFEAEANRMLGHDSDESTRAGMLSGNRSDVGQHAIASGEFKDSSTFQQRLARLADAFRSET